MKQNFNSYFYPPVEEQFNILSHALGLLLSIVGLVLLIFKANELGEFKHLASFSIFGASMILLYAASTFYHSAKKPKIRYRLNILDHSAIYVLIAGSYTPIALLILNGFVGWLIFGIVWALALVGVILKLFYTGRYQTLSTIMYVVMGWIIVFAIKPLIESFSAEGLWWLFAGGIAYTIGALLFSLDKIKFNHAIFHIFVLAGSFCHFISVYFYVL